MTLGSFFDGIGGWLLAAKHAGVKPVWASEIDDFPAAVTAHHFPNVRQMGDITKIKAEDLEPVDIICAGSPCQDLSVAGKRKGLEGERSGLFVDAIKLVHGLRARTGSPRYFVWENVPGAFSSNKGMDFRAFLEEISQTEIPVPQGGKWAESGMVEWDGGSLAWRVLDAQYWGVPQRRKRIFLVTDFDGRSAGEILFVEQGLHGDSTESEGKRKEVTTNVRESVDSASRVGLDIYNLKMTGDKACTITTKTGQYADASGPSVIHTIAGNIIGRQGKNGGNQLGIGQDISPTLNTIDRHAVAYSMGHDERSAQFTPNKTDPLTASDYKQPPIVGALCARDYKGVGNQFVDEGEIVVGSLCAHDGRGFNGQDVEQNKVVYPAGKVRRLTPTECERLQGLPDGYTDIKFNGKPAPDSRRYKALGNGMAQPCADYVIKRIVDKTI